MAPLLVAITFLSALSGIAAPAANATAADDGGFAAKMLELVNQQRAAGGVAPLQAADSLARVAQDTRYDGCGFPVFGRATDMGTRNYFSHTIAGCGTQSVSNVLAAVGVTTSGSDENIAWMSGTTDPLLAAQRLTNDLMASPGHRANIMNPTFTHVGIGSWRTAVGQTWSGGGTALTKVFLTAQVFGKMTPTAPAAPTAVVAAGTDGAITVSWAPPASGSAVDSYTAFAWEASTYSNRSTTVCSSCRSTTVSGLVNGRRYYIALYGWNAAGWGAPGYSAWVTVAAAPGPATDVRAVPGKASISATWRVPTDPGMAIDSQTMFVYDAAGYTGRSIAVCATCTTATVTGLLSGHSYTAVVYTHNPNTWGMYAVSNTVVTSA
jgi:uncharacterized protein YkwD